MQKYAKIAFVMPVPTIERSPRDTVQNPSETANNLAEFLKKPDTKIDAVVVFCGAITLFVPGERRKKNLEARKKANGGSTSVDPESRSDSTRTPIALRGSIQADAIEPRWVPTDYRHFDNSGQLSGGIRIAGALVAAELLHRPGNDIVVSFSGGGNKKTADDIAKAYPELTITKPKAEADIYGDRLKLAASKKGLSEDLVLLPEGKSHNTITGAENIVTMAEDSGWENILVISTEGHLIRASHLVEQSINRRRRIHPDTQINAKYVSAEELCLQLNENAYRPVITYYRKKKSALFREKREMDGLTDLIAKNYDPKEQGINRLSLSQIQEVYINAIRLLDENAVANTNDTIRSLDERADPQGTVDGLLEIGKTIAPFIAAHIEDPEEIMNAWSSLNGIFDANSDFVSIEAMIESIKTAFALVYIEEHTHKRIESNKGKITPKVADRLKTIRSFAEQDLTREEMANRLGVSRPTISRHLAILFPQKRQNQRNETINRVAELDARGFKVTKIAREVGISPAWVSVLLGIMNKSRYKNSVVEKRRDSMEAFVAQRGEITATELAAHFGISLNTILNDVKVRPGLMISKGMVRSKEENEEKITKDGSKQERNAYSGHAFRLYQERPEISASEIEDKIKKTVPQPRSEKNTRIRQIVYLNHNIPHEEIIEAIRTTDGITASQRQIDDAFRWLRDHHLIPERTRGRRRKLENIDRRRFILQSLLSNKKIQASELAVELSSITGEVITESQVYKDFKELKINDLITNQYKRRVKKDQSDIEKHQEELEIIKILWLRGISDIDMNNAIKGSARRRVRELKDKVVIVKPKPTERQVADILSKKEAGVPVEQIIATHTRPGLLAKKTVMAIILLLGMKYLVDNPIKAANILLRRQYILENPQVSINEIRAKFDVSRAIALSDIKFLRELELLSHREVKGQNQYTRGSSSTISTAQRRKERIIKRLTNNV